jgi:hypothetical protein
MRRDGVRLVIGLVALSSLAGCGLLDAMAHPPSTPAPLPSATARTTAQPAPPRTVVTAELSDDRRLPGSPFRVTMTVRVHPVAAGLPPLPGMRSDCGYDPATSRYTAVDLGFLNRSGSVVAVAADLSLAGLPAGAAVGLFTESGGDVRYCQDGDRVPTTDSVVIDGGVGEERTVTTYLVTDAAATDDPARSATLALTRLRNTAYAPPQVTTVGTWTASSGACPSAPDSLCAPLD